MIVAGRILATNRSMSGKRLLQTRVFLKFLALVIDVCHSLLHRNEGPQKEKENLLLLDRLEDWLGRKRPAVLGKEGAEAALERGEKTLADILNQANDYDDNSFGGESAGDGALVKDGWVEGIGEARADEDNLSMYMRMSEGAGNFRVLLYSAILVHMLRLLTHV